VFRATKLFITERTADKSKRRKACSLNMLTKAYNFDKMAQKVHSKAINKKNTMIETTVTGKK